MEVVEEVVAEDVEIIQIMEIIMELIMEIIMEIIIIIMQFLWQL